MKTVIYQRGESQVLTLLLLAIVITTIMYLIWSGEIGSSVHTFSEVLKTAD
ncbi:MAG: hypothetical protein ACSHWN_01880 [Methylophilaceae bacterium]